MLTNSNSSELFSAKTPIGFTIRTTANYWERIKSKHPEITGKEALVQECLERPEMVRRSKQDPRVYLFYRASGKYFIAVIVKRLNQEGFIITSYLTDRAKEGESIWPVSK